MGSASLKKCIQNWRKETNKGLADLRLSKSKLRDYTIAKEDTAEQLTAFAEARDFLQERARFVQAKAHQRIATIVTKCLCTVFDDPYEFRIEFRSLRGKTQADLKFYKGDEEYDPMESAGGGVLDVASFALRLACLVLQKGKVRPILFLDEPFKFVSKNYLPRVASLLEELSNKLGIQIVQVTHLEDLEIGAVTRF